MRRGLHARRDPRVAVGDRLTAEECGFIISHSQAAVVVTTAALLEQMGDLAPDTVALTVVVGLERSGGADTVGYEQALSAAPAMTSFPVVEGDDPSYILYTSAPAAKGAAHSQGGRVAGTVNMLGAGPSCAGFDRSPVYLHVAPCPTEAGPRSCRRWCRVAATWWFHGSIRS